MGFVGGILYEIPSLFRWIFRCNRGKNATIGAILDALFWIGFTIWCIFAAFLFHFPDFRVYMIVGYGIGLIIYLKILHRIVAFFKKVCYNGLTKMVKKAKNKKKLSKKEVD
ncbi:MAG: hypothetical protein IKD47_02585 [Clostridia bacterium]|nr:hypothetical protein [Clostridia bacterium]